MRLDNEISSLLHEGVSGCVPSEPCAPAGLLHNPVGGYQPRVR